MKSWSVVLVLGCCIFFSEKVLWAQTQSRWRELPNAPRTDSRFDDIFFIDPQIGWIIQSRGEIFKTRDGGVTWQLQNTISTAGLRSIGFVNAAKGWLGTLRSNDFFFTTNDSGKTWTEVNIPEPKPAGICGISVVNDSVIYAAGLYDGAPRVIKSTNGGRTWQIFDLSVYARGLVDCYFFNPDSGFVVGATGTTFDTQKATILFTVDGGRNWTPRLTGSRPRELCWKISFSTRRTGYVSIEAFNRGAIYFLKTTDGGLTWQEKILSTTLRDVQGLGFVNEKLGWEGGWRSPTYETTDGGETWHLAGFGMNVNRLRFLNDTLGYAVGQTVYKYSLTAPPVGVEERIMPLPATNTVLQNYPNPFNPSTKIRYTLARDDEIALLSVYDLSGRKIKTLFAGGRSPGDYIAEWDGSTDANEPAAAGIYIYRLQTGGLIQSKKMILMR